jgi:hypothetical protein
MSQHDLLSLLFALYENAREDRPLARPDLEARTGLDAAALDAGLQHLDGRGLVDARRAKLTMRGFAVAHALCAQVASEQRAHAA